MTAFSVGRYTNPETGTTRWAVLGPGDVWYFPKRFERTAAVRLMNNLKRGADEVRRLERKGQGQGA